jgi:hypothetical protein
VQILKGITGSGSGQILEGITESGLGQILKGIPGSGSRQLSLTKQESYNKTERQPEAPQAGAAVHSLWLLNIYIYIYI